MPGRRNVPLGVLLAVIVLLYGDSFGNSFHFDDFHAVTDNPAVRSLGNVPRIFRDATAFSVLPANQTYRPVVTASLALDYALGHGYNVFWFHLSTLLWFLVLIGVLYLLAERIFDQMQTSDESRWLALGVAAWFGVHPAMAETVNYVIQRGDLYCTLGCVAALWIYAARPGWRRYGIYLLPFVLAMLSKPPAAVFPLLLFLYVALFEGQGSDRERRWREALVAAAPALAVDGALLWIQRAMTPRSYAPSILSAEAYRLVQPYVWLRYAGALFLPVHLNVDTDLQPAMHWDAAVTAGFVFVVMLLGLVVWALRRKEGAPIAFGLLWFAVTQLPTSVYTLSEVENDHRMFFSFPGLMIAVVWALNLAWGQGVKRLNAGQRRVGLRAVVAAASIALCRYAYGAHRRNEVWHDEASLWADDAVKSPHNGRGLMNYGLVKMGAGNLTGARALFEQALRYTPNYATLEINLGIVNGALADRGQPDLRAEAERHFERAIALAPKDDTTHAYFGRWLLAAGRRQEATGQLETAIALNGQRQMPRDLLIQAELQSGDVDAARALASRTLAVVPEDTTAAAVLRGSRHEPAPAAAALINTSLAAYRAGHFEESIARARQALQMDPQAAEAWNNVGAGYGGLQQWDQGIAAEQQALQLDPGLAIAGNNLRWFLAQKLQQEVRGTSKAAGEEPSAAAYVNLSLTLNRQGRFAESLLAAQRAVTLDPRSAEAWNNVAADDEALRRWDEAIVAAKRAVALRPDFALARNNLRWSEEQKALEIPRH